MLLSMAERLGGSMAQGVITLCEMRAKGVTMLELACNRCERRVRPKIERLTARACRPLGRP